MHTGAWASKGVEEDRKVMSLRNKVWVFLGF